MISSNEIIIIFICLIIGYYAVSKIIDNNERPPHQIGKETEREKKNDLDPHSRKTPSDENKLQE